MRILLIEEDRDSAESIRDEFEKHYIVDVAYTGVDGTYLSQTNEYDAIVVDVALSDINGIEVCKRTRAASVYTPILVLSDDNSVDYKILSLDSGADDYLTKPLCHPELLAKVRALIRRGTKYVITNQFCVGDLTLDVTDKAVKRSGFEIELRRKEFDLLEYLIQNKGRILSKEKILEHVWEKGMEMASNTLEVHIKFLRDKIDKPFSKKLIKTVHNFGYKIEG